MSFRARLLWSVIATALLFGSPATASSLPTPIDTGDAEARPAPVEEARNLEVSVLTYNVKGLPWPASRNRRSALRAIGRELALMRLEGRQPDIVLIQEGFLRDVDELVRISGYRFWVSGPSRGDRPRGAAPASGARYRSIRYLQSGEGWGKFTSSGLHVLSDAPILEVESMPFRYCAGLDCLANKGVMAARIAFPGLPHAIDVVNTHMNSRAAAKVPLSRSLQAHNLQTDQLIEFIKQHRRPDAPLLVGGDFNVKGAPERYDHDAAARPYKVVSEFCTGLASACQGQGRDPQPWLKSQDLQAFASLGPIEVRPIEVETLFDSPASGEKLSDHNGYLVRYRLSWTPRATDQRIVASAD